jgi:hypothetical protein
MPPASSAQHEHHDADDDGERHEPPQLDSERKHREAMAAPINTAPQS